MGGRVGGLVRVGGLSGRVGEMGGVGGPRGWKDLRLRWVLFRGHWLSGRSIHCRACGRWGRWGL